MPSTIPLPDGTTATLRDELTVLGRRQVASAQAKVGIGILQKLLDAQKAGASEEELEALMPEDKLEASMLLSEVTVRAMLMEWSRPEPITADTVADLPVSVFDALAKETAAAGAAVVSAALNLAPSSDPASPTPPSNA